MSQPTWISVSRGSPCPICTAVDRCSIKADGRGVFCRGENPPAKVDGYKPPVRSKKEPEHLIYWVDDSPFTRPVTPPPPAAPVRDWPRLAGWYARQLTPQRAAELARVLGLPVEVLGALTVGFDPKRDAYTFAEMDAAGTTIGLTRRFRDGSKRMVPGSKRGVYLPIDWGQGDGPIIVPEGVSDVLALTAAGLNAVGRPAALGGVEILSEVLEQIPPSRQVVVIGEHDPSGTGQRAAADVSRRLTELLKRPVLWALPPAGAKDSRQWMVSAGRSGQLWHERGAEFLNYLVSNTKTVEPQPTKPPVPALPSAAAVVNGFPPPQNGEAWNDPGRIARLYVDKGRTADGLATIGLWRQEWFRWGSGAWAAVAEPDLTADLARHLHRVYVADHPARVAAAAAVGEPPPKLYPVTTNAVANVRLNLAALVNIPDDGRDLPFLLAPQPDWPPVSEIIATPDGLYTLDAIAAGQPAFAQPTPTLFSLTCLPFRVTADPPPPETWHRCLGEWFKGDRKGIDLLQELLGLFLSSDTSTHKIGMLIGPPRSGKGTILRIVASLVGERNVASTTFARLASNFGLQQLVGKTVATIPDARVSGKLDTAVVTERLLSISGEDLQSIDRKHLSAVTAKLSVRFLLASNLVPVLSDPSGAIASRFVFLSTPNSFLGKEDHGLMDRLRGELAGILRWAADGWVRLKANGKKFTVSDTAAELHRQLSDLSSPTKMFVAEACRLDPASEVSVTELFTAWRDWCKDRNREEGSEQIFGRNLKAAFPHVRDTRPVEDGRRVRKYAGLTLKLRHEWGEEDEKEDTPGAGTAPRPQSSAVPSIAREGETLSGPKHQSTQKVTCNGADRGRPRTGTGQLFDIQPTNILPG